MSLAMAAGMSKTRWSMDDLCSKMDEVPEKPGSRFKTASVLKTRRAMFFKGIGNINDFSAHFVARHCN
jgi:hypothetical protein